MLKTKWHFEINLLNSFECKSKTVAIESLRVFPEFLTRICSFRCLFFVLVNLDIVWCMAFLYLGLLYGPASGVSCACCMGLPMAFPVPVVCVCQHFFLCLLQLRKMQEKLARMQAEIESKRPAVQPNGNIKTHDV